MSDLKRYKEFSAELVNNTSVTAAEIYDYELSPLFPLFDRFYKFCQDNLLFHCADYAIQPARFYYHNDVRVNASAGTRNNYYIIKMNMGTIVSMYNHFYDHNDAFENDRHLSTTYPGLLPADVPPGFLMYQVVIQFTYYHELAHLVQKSPELNAFISEEYLDGPGVFSPEKHAREFDSDLHAGQMIYDHIFDFWKKIPEEQRTENALSKLISLCLSGIFTFFTFLEGVPAELYFEEKNHPHPLVRITYIMDVIIHVLEKDARDVRIDSNSCIKEALNITSRVAAGKSLPDPVRRYREVFSTSYDQIEDYVNKLIKSSDGYSNLVKNRFGSNDH